MSIPDGSPGAVISGSVHRRSRWPRLTAGALVILAVSAGLGCSDDGDSPVQLEVAAIEAVGCDRPQPRSGVGTFVADGIILTAAHVVEGDLRDLRVDDAPAALVGLDLRTDLALVAVHEQIDGDTAPEWDVSVNDGPADGPVTVLTADGAVDTELVRRLTLRVDDLSDDTLTEREALELDIVVDEGDSGSPVLDGDGNLLGVVVLRRPSSDVSYASVVPPLDELMNPSLYQDLRAGPLAGPQPCT